jgi:hypothetical protein
MDLLKVKLRPLLLQFPWFNKYEIPADEFSRRLRFLLKPVRDLPTWPICWWRSGTGHG